MAMEICTGVQNSDNLHVQPNFLKNTERNIKKMLRNKDAKLVCEIRKRKRLSGWSE